MGTGNAVAVVLAGALVVSLAAQTGSRESAALRASPLDNPDGTRPGLMPITSAGDRARAVRLIRGLRVAGMGPKSGYRRERFGENWADVAGAVPYSRNGCDTRNDLLARDGDDVRFREGSSCVVVAMTLEDPYTGRTIRFRKADADRVQVDHVVPLSYEWRMGASRWSRAKRLRIANDPLNLLPVYGPANEDKGGSGPAAWLPPSHRIRCAYVVRFAQVALKYDLPVTRADKSRMLAECR
ncbi:lipoprotein [Acrocarpospora phusangensis]|uniref:Lipoprotein n=1 Tax=Acrocarpospora phusangensis TaxID=1070424 RepID=A0A919QHR8_9ACTN|nr:HNH endonuclease family protein [Acrocarpospora phusangensis]GIH28101.1 lipoprotein [Acrocarpospora phusangensis]